MISNSIKLKSCKNKDCDIEYLGKHIHFQKDVILINDEREDIEITYLEGKI